MPKMQNETPFAQLTGQLQLKACFKANVSIGELQFSSVLVFESFKNDKFQKIT